MNGMDNHITLKKLLSIVFIYCLFLCHDSLAATKSSNISKKEEKIAVKSATSRDSNNGRDELGAHISSNPAAVEDSPSSGRAQRYIEKAFGIKDNYGFNYGGAWLGDVDELLSGGVPHAKRSTGNSLLLANLTWDPEKITRWKGALFGAEFLQLNAQDTNGQAGVVQGYNSLPGPPPLSRGELYQLWYRQKLFNDKLSVRIGKLVPTIDFNNVIRPVPIGQGAQSVPSVTGLIYTPIFINTTMLGVVPGYYNSAYGGVISFMPVKQWYALYGIYDGSLAQGKQTGLEGPNFNGTYVQLGEIGFAWLIHGLPGTVAVGAWNQHGPIITSPTLTENGASGFYSFGAQRLWYRDPTENNSGISAFYQYGINNSDVMPMTQFVGFGLTAFGLVPKRPDDSFGVGTAISWLNQSIFSQRTESMFQVYYQAQVVSGIFLEPVVSYIPNPGANPNLPQAWAGTLRAIVLF